MQHERYDDDYTCGTPSMEEWQSFWRCGDDDPEVTNEEYEAVCRQLSSRLADFGRVGYKSDCDFYFREDNRGDRTLYLEIVNPDVLCALFLLCVQMWLREPDFCRYRILVVTYVNEAATIMVYPSCIRLGREYDGIDLHKSLAHIVSEMKSLPEFND